MTGQKKAAVLTGDLDHDPVAMLASVGVSIIPAGTGGVKPIDLVLSKLPSAKPNGRGWQAACPAHDDHDPSLSITEADDGTALLFCHAGCTFPEIIGALGLEPKDLFPINGTKPGKPRIVATYDYQDADGALLFQTVKYDPKDYRQRRPDGNGGWTWNLKDTSRVLYHLPEVLAADPSEWVFVCEGEKSADAIRSLGLVATTAPLGAGKWKGCDQSPLEGRKVAILPDDDPQGQNHALDVTGSLKDVAEARRIVKLPAVMFEKSDPADWVQAGGTRDDLLALLDQTPEVGETPLFWDGEGNPTTADFVAALHSIGYHFRLNVCNDQVEVNAEPMSDVLRATIRSEMRDLGYRQVNVLEDAWTAHAAENPFHPVKDWLDGLRWDGQDHMGALADCVKDKHDLFPVFMRRWCIGAVARACERKSCQNRMLVLDGAQGLGKSELVRWLASPLDPELYIEGPINPDDKDNLIRLITTWIWEVCELGSTTRRSDREALKYFLSLQQVTVRKPYGHYDLVKPALASFVGTVNNVGGFFDDPTGYRRFMSVHLEAIDWRYSQEIDPVQLWAQAQALYDAGESWELTRGEAEMAEFANREYEVDDPLVDLIGRYFEVTGDPGDFVSTVDLRDTLNTYGWQLRNPRAENVAIADAMTHYPEATKARARVGASGRQERGYQGMRKR
jgi:putative DNA primase/helicase